MEIEGVRIDYLGHAGFLITSLIGVEKRIVIDPYNVPEIREKADIILITHSHYDHCSIKDIQALARRGTIVILSADSQSKGAKLEGVEMQVIEPGEVLDFGSIKIEAVPAYNTNKEFHPKKEGWMGYLIKMRGVVIYHAGDSDKIPEMERLTGYGRKDTKFIALLPVSGKYVMNADEAAEAALIIKADLAIPMHYGAGVAGTIKDAEDFVQRCKEFGINARVLERIQSSK